MRFMFYSFRALFVLHEATLDIKKIYVGYVKSRPGYMVSGTRDNPPYQGNFDV